VKITLNDAGIRNLLRSTEIRNNVTEKASEIARRCGEGYEAADPHDTGQRTAVNIYPATSQARQDNYDNNTLKKELYR